MAKNYLADTKNASAETMAALQDMAQRAGVKNYENMNSQDLTTAIKYVTGASGNTYGNTIGNKTLNQYGYQTDKNGNITRQATPNFSDVGNANAVVSNTGVTKLPGYEGMFDASMVTPAVYQQAVLNEQIRAQNEQMMQMMQQQYDQQQAALKAQTQSTVNSINSNRQGIEDAYQKAQREAYINSVLQQNQMGDYLAAAGYTGGMAESTLAQINNNYANNRQMATSERDAANLEIDRMVAEAQATGNAQLADAANNYYTNYLSALQNQQQLDYQLNQDLMSSMEAERLYQAQIAQQQLENERYNREYADAQAQQRLENERYNQSYTDQQTQQQWENAWNEKTYADSQTQQQLENERYNQQYADSQAQQKWENTWFEKQYADQLAQQLLENSWYEREYADGKAKSGSGGDSGSDSGSDSKDSSDDAAATPTSASASYSYIKRVAQGHLNSRDADGRITGAEAALNYINKSDLTDKEKQKLAKELGLI